MSSKVWAIVVTYNRKELLERCLDALNAQTRPCDHILIIDNASTDGTDAWLKLAVNDHTSAYTMSHNTGGAGGFNAGMRLAYQNGADLLWLMDDDVIPAPDALEQLLKARTELERRQAPHAFVVSTAWTEQGLLTNAPDVDGRQNEIQYGNWALCLDAGLVAVRRATFVSILFSKEVLADHGLPIAPMFIWADDSEYTVRVTHDRPGYLVGASRVLHVRAAPGAPSLATETNPIRIGFHRLLTRNTAYLVRTHYGRRALWSFVKDELRRARRLAFEGHMKKASVVLQGLWQGLHFHPRVEPADGPGDASGAKLTKVTAWPSASPRMAPRHRLVS